MKKKESIIIIVVVICILLIFIITLFATNELKVKNDNNDAEKSTKIITSEGTNKITTTTTSSSIDMQKWLKENEFELYNSSDVDYTKSFKTYTIDMNLKDFKELNYENVSKGNYPDKWKFSKDKIELFGSTDSEMLTISTNYEKALYKETPTEGDSPTYDIIVFYHDKNIKFYHTAEYCNEKFAITKTVNYVNSSEVYYNEGLSFFDGNCSESGLSGMYLKNSSGDYYNLVDNNIIYKKDLLNNVLWHGSSIIINNQNEVYYRSKKVENLKFLSLIYEEDLTGGNDSIAGIISSDYYYYQISFGKLERKKIKSIYITKKEIEERNSKPHIVMEFEDGTYSDNDLIKDFVADINYLKNL